MNDHEDEIGSIDDGHEELPFAVDHSIAEQLHDEHHTTLSKLPTTADTSILSSSSLVPPALESSIVSCPTSDSSGHDSFSSSMHSQLLDAAASLLPSASFLSVSATAAETSSLPSVPAAETTASATANDDDGSFSMLMQAADDTRQISPYQVHQHHHRSQLARLPALLEEQSTNSSQTAPVPSSGAPLPAVVGVDGPEVITPAVDIKPAEDTSSWVPRNLLLSFQDCGAATIIPPGMDQSISEERRLARLAGATASRTSSSSFVVGVDVPAPDATLADVMDLLGNPDLLPLWCDAIPDLVITRTSEGARTAANRTSPASATDREYEGEWIEATTSQLRVPSGTGCVYATARAVSATLGFPEYGRVSMFVERRRGQVGLTMGPFPGQFQVAQRVTAQLVGGKVRLSMEVRLERTSVAFCSLWETFEQCLLPTIDDYMDQALSSTARLRFLMENGETVPMNSSGLQTPLLPSVA